MPSTDATPMTPDPRIAEIRKRHEADEARPRGLWSAYAGGIHADRAFLLSDRERAIDEAAMRERERAAKIVDGAADIQDKCGNDWQTKPARDERDDQDYRRHELECFRQRDILRMLAATIRRPTDTESGG